MLTRHHLMRVAALAIFTLAASGCMPYSTSPTEVGVRTNKLGLLGGKGVVDTVYEPGGTYFFVPFITDWHTFDTRLQSLEMTAAVNRGDRPGRDDLLFKSIDGNDIGLDVIITYQIVPEEAPLILQQVAESDEQLRSNIVRTIARSKPRDIFGELQTEEFYVAEERTAKAEQVRTRLNEILGKYGVTVQRVSTRDYRFNEEYQQAIEEKKVADQMVEKLKSETAAAEEEYRTKVAEAEATNAKIQEQADGEYRRAVIEADAYFEQQKRIARAIEAEAIAEAEAMQRLNLALSGVGAEKLISLAIAEALQGKRIVMLPEGGFDIRSTNVNELLQLYGLKAMGDDAQATPQPAAGPSPQPSPQQAAQPNP